MPKKEEGTEQGKRLVDFIPSRFGEQINLSDVKGDFEVLSFYIDKDREFNLVKLWTLIKKEKLLVFSFSEVILEQLEALQDSQDAKDGTLGAVGDIPDASGKTHRGFIFASPMVASVERRGTGIKGKYIVLI